MRIDITYKVTENGCWECNSHKPNQRGYFQICVNRKIILLHRYMYMQEIGPIKDGNMIRHTCDNKKCINPNHLLEGTHADNMQDMMDRNRFAKGTRISNSVLNEQQVLEILSNTTDSNKELARKYNANSATIRDVRVGRTWKHLKKG
jgi:hypothetical protein